MYMVNISIDRIKPDTYCFCILPDMLNYLLSDLLMKKGTLFLVEKTMCTQILTQLM